MPVKRASIAQVMMVVALAAVNLAVMRSGLQLCWRLSKARYGDGW
jgi:hypothetical protein